MGEAIGLVLPPGVGVALSLLPIIAVVQAIDSFTPVRSLGTATVLSGFIPMDLLLTLGAGVSRAWRR